MSCDIGGGIITWWPHVLPISVIRSSITGIFELT